jgi:hypothetical protein
LPSSWRQPKSIDRRRAGTRYRNTAEFPLLATGHTRIRRMHGTPRSGRLVPATVQIRRFGGQTGNSPEAAPAKVARWNRSRLPPASQRELAGREVECSPPDSP